MTGVVGAGRTECNLQPSSVGGSNPSDAAGLGWRGRVRAVNLPRPSRPPSLPAPRAARLLALVVACCAVAAAARAEGDPEQTLSGVHAWMAAEAQAEAEPGAAAREADWLDLQGPAPALRDGAAGQGLTALKTRVYGYLPYFSPIVTGGATLRWDLITDLVVFDADLKSDGTVSSWHGWPQAGLVSKAHANGVKIHLCAVLFNSASPGGEIAALLASPAARAQAIHTLVNSVQQNGADGLNYDFEFVPSTSRDAFSVFVEETRKALDAAVPGAELTLATPANTGYRGYDFARLAVATDRILLMAYDYHWTSAPNTGPVAPLTKGAFWGASTSTDITGVLAVAPAAKLAMGVPYYGNDWAAESDQRNAKTTAKGKSVLLKSAIPNAATYGRLWDADAQNPWYRYQSSGVWHQAWYDDGPSLTAKYQWSKGKALGGVMIWALGYDSGLSDAEGALLGVYGGGAVADGGSDAGADAGPDAGADGGQADAGATDAGATDAGATDAGVTGLAALALLAFGLRRRRA
jgi:hypothetical protein